MICEYCGGEVAEGSLCPRGIDCPVCAATVGQRCRRPSGHLAETLHAPRIRLAEQLDPTEPPRSTNKPLDQVLF